MWFGKNQLAITGVDLMWKREILQLLGSQYETISALLWPSLPKTLSSKKNGLAVRDDLVA